jgi:hypothetical protein
VDRVPLDPDWVALEARLKPCVRTTVPTAHAARLAAALRHQGAWVVEADELVNFSGAERQSIVYAARSADAAEAARRAEADTLAKRSHADPHARLEAHRALGSALGYPRCCVEAFVERIARFDEPNRSDARPDEDYVQTEPALRALAGRHPDRRLNVLLAPWRLRLITHYPCRLDCPASVAYATAVWSAMARKDVDLARELDLALAVTVALARDGARAVLDGVPRAPRGHNAPPRVRDEALAAQLAEGQAPDGILTVTYR